jgi:V8-like Glu-specific endopeptidase
MANEKDNQIVGSHHPMPTSAGQKQVPAPEYWTEARRAAARPKPLARVEPGKAHVTEAQLRQGEPGHTPNAHGTEAEPQENEKPMASGGQAVASPLSYPFRTCGKLFFTQGGGGYAGSASLVSPNIILTAGHCVYEGGWSSNIAFYPSYGKRASNDRAYVFSPSYIACWTAWSQQANRAFDYGMMWVDSTPGNLLGWLGTLWNANTSGRTWDAVGYPATPNPPFSGNTMDSAIGQVVASSVSGTIGLSNDNMEHGSSGGPWITSWNEASPTHANGLQSFHLVDGASTEFGPYFTQDLNGLYNWISNPANRK